MHLKPASVALHFSIAYEQVAKVNQFQYGVKENLSPLGL